MRIVITGATSFVGAAAIQELLENGHEVYAVVRPSSRKLETLTGQEAGKNALREGRLHIVENDLSAPELSLIHIWDFWSMTCSRNSRSFIIYSVLSVRIIESIIKPDPC